MKPFVTGLVLGLALLLSHSAKAQTYSIDWYTIDGGGGDSSGGTYSLSGTIGQPDAGSMSGGTYSLDGGYWSIISTGQAGSPPSLSIVLSGVTATISWPDTASNFILEQSPNLAPGSWSSVAPTATNNGIITSQRPATGQAMMFRLHQGP